MTNTALPIPTTFDIAAISGIVPYVGNLQRLEVNNIRIDGEPTITINPDEQWVTVRGKSSQISVFFNNAQGLTRRSRADAVFDYTMCKLAEMYHNNAVKGSRDIIVKYPIKDLVDIGLYEDVRSARRGFEKAMRAIQAMQVSGSKRIRKGPLGETMTHIISDSTIDKGVAEICMGNRINWRAEVKQYIQMPINAFSLCSRAYRLTKAIYRLIRIHRYTDWFEVSFRYVALKANIQLDYHNSSEMKNAILDAIEEVKKCKGLCIGLKTVVSNEKKLDRWLDESKLLVHPNSDILGDMTKISASYQQKIAGKTEV